MNCKMHMGNCKTPRAASLMPEGVQAHRPRLSCLRELRASSGCSSSHHQHGKQLLKNVGRRAFAQGLLGTFLGAKLCSGIALEPGLLFAADGPCFTTSLVASSSGVFHCAKLCARWVPSISTRSLPCCCFDAILYDMQSQHLRSPSRRLLRPSRRRSPTRCRPSSPCLTVRRRSAAPFECRGRREAAGSGSGPAPHRSPGFRNPTLTCCMAAWMANWLWIVAML